MFKINKSEKNRQPQVRVVTPLLKSRDQWPAVGVKAHRRLNRELKAMDSSDYGIHYVKFDFFF
jgi:hypothetical protein